MLKARALSATLWSGADALLSHALLFVVSIILARLLSPEEFGTVALLSLFTGLASVFVNSGFSSALIQQQDVSHVDESTVFWFNLGMGVVAGLSLWAAAPWIASFFGKPILVPLTGVMAVNVFLSSVGSIHRTLLTKSLDFRTLMKVSGTATLLSGGVAVAMAWLGFGVWALAVQAVAATAATSLLLWLLSSWRPAPVFSLASARRLFGFGGYLMVSGLLDVVYARVYTVLIGKLYGVRDLGFYNRAEGTKQIPAELLTDILSRVAFPIFSATAADTARLRLGVQLALRGIMLVNVPMMLGLAAVAEPLVSTLFGARWLPAVPVMRVLCLGAVFWPLHVINLNALLAQGHSRLFFRLEVAKKVLGVSVLAVGAMYGMMGLAWSQVAFAVLAFGINAYYSNRLLGYGAVAQARDLAPTLAIAIPMAMGTYWVGTRMHLAPILELLALTGFGAASYLLVAWVCRLAALRDVIELLRSRAQPGTTTRGYCMSSSHASAARRDWVEISDPHSLAEKPVVSVLMLAYNHGPYLAQAIEGVVMQETSFPIELLIGEDCSTDNTREIALNFQRRYPRLVRVITSAANVGAKANSLRLFQASRGEFLAFCEGDDYWTAKDKLHRQLAVFDSRPEVTICAHRSMQLDTASGRIMPMRRSSERARDYSLADVILGGGGFLATASLVLRRTALCPMDDWFLRCPVGDYPIQIWASSVGVCHSLADVGCVYRRGVPGSWSSSVEGDVDVSWRNTAGIIAMLEEFPRKSGRRDIEWAVRQKVRSILRQFHLDVGPASFKALPGRSGLQSRLSWMDRLFIRACASPTLLRTIRGARKAMWLARRFRPS